MGAKEVVQLYVSSAHKGISRPVQELKGFEKVYVAPGKTETVTFRLCKRAFSYYCVELGDWYAEGGAYEIRIGASSRDIRLTGVVELEAGRPVPVLVTADTTFGDMRAIPGADQVLAPLLQGLAGMFGSMAEGEEGSGMGSAAAEMADAMLRYMPLHGLVGFSQGAFSVDQMNQIIAALNAIQRG